LGVGKAKGAVKGSAYDWKALCVCMKMEWWILFKLIKMKWGKTEGWEGEFDQSVNMWMWDIAQQKPFV
jgi:hypothetical protein